MSKYSEEQRKIRLYTAIKMRDEVIERPNHKTGAIEKMKYSRSYIQKINGLKTFEAEHLGIFKKKPTQKQIEQMQNAVAESNRKAKAEKLRQNKKTSRRIKEQ